ncbi:hypothetical protein GC173_03460 [bacterium]|nr:hypothetical protein [bacterium]
MQTREIDWLPGAEAVMARLRAAAVVDAILSPDPELRQYFFQPAWQPGVAMAERRDGSGWFAFAVQEGDTVAVKVSMARASLGPDALARFVKQPPVPIPETALRFLRDADLRPHELSFLAWSTAGSAWQALDFMMEGKNSIDMGRERLRVAEQGAKAYYLFAKDYHELALDPAALKAIFAATPLDEALATSLCEDVEWGAARTQVARIGYPLA